MKSLMKVKYFRNKYSFKYKYMKVTLQNTIKTFAIINLHVYLDSLYMCFDT